MDLQDYNYEANAAHVSLEQVTSSAANAKILERLLVGDDELKCLGLGLPRWGWIARNTFIIREGDYLGWLGYFIGRSEHLESLHIWSMPAGEEGEQIDAFVKGIARNKYIRNIRIGYMSDDARAAIVRAVGNYSQLEKLENYSDGNLGPNSHSALGTLLESGVCSLRELWLTRSSISDDVICSFVNGLKSVAGSLEVLVLSETSIGNEGLLAVVAGLANCTTLNTLNLSSNDFSSAVEGLRSLSEWLHRSPMTLQQLNIQHCQLNDQGLQAFTQGSAIHCRELILKGNESITATGLRCLSNSLQSDSSRVKLLDLQNLSIGEDGIEALARGLAENKSLTSLRLNPSYDNVLASLAMWIAFYRVLCDPSSVNSTYLSNHTIHTIICGENNADIALPEYICVCLRLNEQHPKNAARCKILMKHKHLDMRPFLQWGLKLLPVALAWFERAKACTTLYDRSSATEKRRFLEESDVVFERRMLSATYEFVRKMSLQDVMKSRNGLELTAAYDEKIKIIEEENTIHSAQRESKNAQLREEIVRLEGKNKRIIEENTMRSAQHDRENKQLGAEIARLEHENERIEEEKTVLLAQRAEEKEQHEDKIAELDRKNKDEIAQLKRENKRIMEDNKADLEERDRKIMQLGKEIVRLEHENKRLNFFIESMIVMLICFAALVLQFVFARL